jgi:hypothetical protein
VAGRGAVLLAVVPDAIAGTTALWSALGLALMLLGSGNSTRMQLQKKA